MIINLQIGIVDDMEVVQGYIRFNGGEISPGQWLRSGPE
jgi:hypothetical protein